MLSSRCLLILFSFATVIQLTYGRLQKYKKASKSGDQDFDLLIFTQHWPGTVCMEWEDKNPSHRCLLPRHEEWTIHGIWPNKLHKLAPLFCNTTQRFNESALSPIIHQLDDKWINIEDGTPHYSFWRHEWEKHGTCASVLPEVNTELKYFQKGLDLLQQYDMTRVLAKSNILPGQNYAVQQIIDGVQQILGKHILLTCVVDHKTHESYILEIRICLDKSFKLIDCDDVPDFPTNCSRKKPVNYPDANPGKYNVVLI